MDDPFEELRSWTFADWDEAYVDLGFNDDSPLSRIVLRMLTTLASTVDQWLRVYSYAADAASIERAVEQIRPIARTREDIRQVILATQPESPLHLWALGQYERVAITFADWGALVPEPVPCRKLMSFQATALIHIVCLASTFDQWDVVRVATRFAEPQLSRNAIEMMAHCARTRAQWRRIIDLACEDSSAYRLAVDCLRRIARRAKH